MASTSVLRIVVIGATGGLGQKLTLEALRRGHTVSVLVRSRDKLEQTFSGDDLSRIARVHIGSATEPEVAKAATAGVDVVLNNVGAQPEVSRVLATAAVANNVRKFVHVAGASNVMSEDGVTPHWKEWVEKLPRVESMFKAHQGCIDAIRATGINHVVFCPGYMKPVGKVSVPPVSVRINRPSGPFVSYEDAAVVVVDAAERSEWDGELITAATQTN